MLRDIYFCSGDSFGSLRAVEARFEKGRRRKVLMEHAPGAVHMHSVVGDKPAAGKNSIALRVQILRETAYVGKHCGASLNSIFGCELRIIHGGKVLAIEPFGSVQRIVQRQQQWGAGAPLRLRQLKWSLGA